MENLRAPINQRRRSPKHAHHRRPTVLFIDDDPDVVGAVSVALRNYDVFLLTSYTGQQGIWEAIRAKPALIVTDLCMPSGSGEMLLECLKRNQQTCNIPVIVLSGQRGGDLPGHMRHLGASRFLRKPISISALLGEMRRYVKLRELDWRRSAK